MTQIPLVPSVVITSPKKYDLIYIDCPWSYTNFGTASASGHYALMSQQDICGLDLRSILNPKGGMVLVWATGPRLNFAIEAIKSWGLHYRGVAFVWVKTRKADNGIISGQGVPPTFTKPTTEFLLCASTKKSGRPLGLKVFNAPQVILAPREGHSVKPEVFRTTIDSILGNSISKLEIFARKLPVSPLWEAIGNEITGEDVRTSIQKLNGSLPVVSVGATIPQPGTQVSTWVTQLK